MKSGRRGLRNLLVTVGFALAALRPQACFAGAADPAGKDSAARDLAGLHLIETPVPNSQDSRMAVLYSGDGGWAGIDKDISGDLARKGVPTVGISSLRYFWKRRTREEAGRDLGRILRGYLAKWKKRDVMLLGYSLGADVLPAMVSTLPPDLLDHVALIGLMGAAKTYDLEFHLREWIPIDQDFPYPVLPEVEKLRGRNIVCVYGKKEAASPCPDLDPSLARPLALPGGHHFRAHYASVVKFLLDASLGKPSGP